MKKIKGDLILTKDTIFNEDIEVTMSIKGGDFDLTVNGNIKCHNIRCGNLDAHNIECWNVDCHNIHCRDLNGGDIRCWDINSEDIRCHNIDTHNINCNDLDCWDINCNDINCHDVIYCKTLKKKANSIIRARALIKNRFQLKIKEWK